VALGHRFSKYFSVEVGYGHTKFDGNLVNYTFDHPLYGPVTVKSFATFKINPVLATVEFMYPLGDGFIYAGGGYGLYKVDYKVDHTFLGS
ncbi:MAG: hypothetical protein GWN14_25270, partial [candidate division Zixibacteria bacterium]|nr:hypothetical protein [candidate division Zixibacteria bacterium]NIX59138.1 hypothetical protein [candidate division Zixibacteria bacterium]